MSFKKWKYESRWKKFAKKYELLTNEIMELKFGSLDETEKSIKVKKKL